MNDDSPRGPLLRQDGTVVARVAEEAQEVRGKGFRWLSNG